MKVARKYHNKVAGKLLPWGTRRRFYYELGWAGITIIRNEGWLRFWTKFTQWAKERTLRRVRTEGHSDAPPTTFDDWSDYRILSQQISQANNRRLETFRPKPSKLVSISERELSARAASLRLPIEEKPLVSIIITTVNDAKLTMECLSTVEQHTKDVSYEVVLIDDGSVKEASEIFSKVRNITYLKNPQNLGSLISRNRAAEKARGEFLLFLRNDAQVTEDWLRLLLETVSKHEDVGAVGTKVLYPDGRLQEAGARIKPDATLESIGLFDDPELPRYNYTREVEYCSGVCLLVRANIFREVGGFDAAFAPAHCEDADLCLRIRRLGRRVLYNPKSVIVRRLGATTRVESSQQREYVVTNEQKLSEKWQEQIDDFNRTRLIAFYLPQYHPIPENDLWWGKGFTEWTNVTKASPNFVGHYQPHLPSDLGFYDLRAERVMDQQAELAKRYGVYGFCFYYYWFQGRRLLELPLERMLITGKPDIPFCLSWANESWTRTWDGQADHVLMAQRHSEDDDRAVIVDIMRYLRHPNYIRINGKPVLLIYRAGLFPDIWRTTEVWRKLCREDGIGEIYLVMEEAFEHAGGINDPSKYGFDASVERPLFQMPAAINPPGDILNPDYAGTIHDYRDLVLMYAQKLIPGHVRFRSVAAGWDNTPRRQDAPRILINSSPGAYQAWLESIIEQTRDQNSGDERVVFINAWNEWAEGNYLEPDQRFGHGFLEATRNALERASLMPK